MTLGYVALYHSSSTKETMALHRAGCADIERDRERHGSNLQAFEAENVTAALEVVIDDELTEMGYTHNDVRVYPCVTRTEAKEAAMPTAAPNRANFPAGANGTRRYNQAVIQFKQALARESTEAKEATVTQTATTDPTAVVVPAPTRRGRKPATKPAPNRKPVKSTAKATAAKPAVKKETASKATVRSRVPVPSGFKSWEDPKLVARILKEKASGKTIKEITAGLKLPVDERHAHKVSLAYRKAADAKGTRTTKRPAK